MEYRFEAFVGPAVKDSGVSGVDADHTVFAKSRAPHGSFPIRPKH
jgi:hypothetical protein